MIIDASSGTCILGSRFDRLLTTYRDREDADYPHRTVGELHYHEDWLLVRVDDDIARYYANTVKKQFGVDLNWKSKSGAHVSVIRGETLPSPAGWGLDEGRQIEIAYTHQIYTNGNHWWLNVVCDELADVRTSFGLPTNKRFFHLTIGRLDLTS